MRYLTYPFAHSETLDRARRWLIDAGVAPDRIRVHHHGVPMLIVAAEAAEVDGLKMVIRAADASDPDGLPGLWDLARIHHNDPHLADEAAIPITPARSASFPLAWEAVDSARDENMLSQVELQRAYRESRA